MLSLTCNSKVKMMNEKDLDIVYEKNFLQESSLRELFEKIKKECFIVETFLDKGNSKMPRLIKWYGEKDYAYANIYHPALTIPEFILPVMNQINVYLKTKNINSQMNSVLINYYRNGKDKISYHSDDLSQIGNSPVISSISLGESRIFSFKNKITKEKKELMLHNGDLCIMKGSTQEYWLHAILPEEEKGERINLTFRNTLTQPHI